jgi:hypothetical protein
MLRRPAGKICKLRMMASNRVCGIDPKSKSESESGSVCVCVCARARAAK